MTVVVLVAGLLAEQPTGACGSPCPAIGEMERGDG